MIGISLGINNITSRGGASSAPPFDPSDLPNLLLWLDADDPATVLSGGGLVAQWSDKSPNARHLGQGSDASKPQTGINTINGKNVLYFDGNRSLINGALGITSTDVTMMMVRKTTDTNYIFFSNSTNYTLVAQSGSASTVLQQGYGAATFYKNGVLQSFTTRGGAFTAYDGAEHIAMYKGYNLSGTGGRLELSGYASLTFIGDVGEIVFLDAATNAQINQVGAYLSAKWGISWTDL